MCERGFLRNTIGWLNTNATGTDWYDQHEICPAGYRLPTESEIQSLQETSSVWTAINGVNGRLFADALFLPAVGHRGGGGGIAHVGNLGFYWSSTPAGAANAMEIRVSNVWAALFQTPRSACASLR